ncbi:MAG TPA: alpha/beta fold hydrolase [Patescibacteria group bacterium]
MLFLAPGASIGSAISGYRALTKGKYKIIAPDYLGRGKSSNLKNGNYIKESAKVISDLVERLKLNEVTIVAVSYGTMVANEMAKQGLPEPIKKIILIAPGEYFSPEQRALLKGLFIPANTFGKIQTLYERLIFGKYGFMDKPEDVDRETLNKQWMETLDYEIKTRKGTQIPCLLICFSKDKIVDKESIEKLKRIYRNNEILWFDEEHPLRNEDMKKLNRTVMKKIKKLI